MIWAYVFNTIQSWLVISQTKVKKARTNDKFEPFWCNGMYLPKI